MTCLSCRAVQSCSLLLEKAQNQPQASHSLHHNAAPRPGEEISSEAVPIYCRAGRVLLLPVTVRDPGQDLVSEQTSQSQKASGGRGGETQDSCWHWVQGCVLPWFFILCLFTKCQPAGWFSRALQTGLLAQPHPPPPCRTSGHVCLTAWL